MAESTDRRADATRQQIIRAAAHQFAQRPYHDVGLDDILTEAELTKGAMYFHFRSKHALALAVIDEQLARAGAAVQSLVDRKLSGLETLIDVGYLMAVEDICRDTARAVLHLLPVVGRGEGLQTTVLNNAVQALSVVAERAVAEGDIVDREPQDLARMLVALYLGLRQAGDLDDPEQFLRQIEQGFVVVLPGMVPNDRIDYFLQFIRRRTALAVKTASANPVAADDDRAG
ncbi:TetR/AcrR family transcriptional regulator [Mycolicibacter senuensis]|uniref:TetR family transcriptional regulator n=1 Tax=Mycolicibacter senuensis TaxID=386913 RepID=A0A7I9XJ92_9MYCO|nr:TetR/AcrR family transcriptional regulator [Mycolicibacter senuensis]ORW67617.1 TetR family transcriptional regulator [Mycolicibacter senuensis]GFG70015.1 TetR family transcriptional regulator [Mycolicibacter senuensis]